MSGNDSRAVDAREDADRFRHLFENVQDAVVEFELHGEEPVVATVNDAFCEMFGVNRGEVVGASLNDLIVPSERMTESNRFDQRTAAGKSNYAIVDRRTEDGLKTLLYRGIPYDGGDRGFALYTDLTDEIRQERELAVLNRVLRYNLSEDVDALLGHAEELAASVDDPELAATASALRERALALERTSEEARDLERVLDADPVLEPTPLGEVVQSALADVPLADYADVTVDVGDAPAVLSGGHLDRAVAALVDNAVRYADAETPVVEITARRTDDAVELTVRDRGPGLPDTERRLLTGDVDLTPLDHGSGLGLWLVRWIATAYDGAVAYDERDDGSAITLELRAATGD
ncbi:PAS domain-containing sensor histidine kinase [Halobacterium sp. CBA1126]|uniref:PAS domain-containing sensor histidine kinase n=1 Tax=Halobacterium sp. CBA1126 TaxID=2668074 RepID=UPI0012F83C52|nr:PAS domain-containing sensor histidine kinase [Halobacterium sp. CBA1126]MUV59249.1 PAS domain S-box protein [Halobacterium sp. CBA1126]